MTENTQYLTEQLITYIGNKRSLLPFIKQGVEIVQKELNKEFLHCFDVFSGSGIVSRFLKSYASSITTNDLETYAKIISSCYLSNKSSINFDELEKIHSELVKSTTNEISTCELNNSCPGFVSELYAPKDEDNVQFGERCFYTPYNAKYIDIIRQKITDEVPAELQKFFIAPLLSEVSVHANTAGIFKGFYKNSRTGKGQFGGNGKNALERIKGKIELPLPIFSNFECPSYIFQEDANTLILDEMLYNHLPEKEFDLAYIDPPYNQHPYGSNYFMLNLIANYQRPDCEKISRVSGIPKDWNRSSFNRKRDAAESFTNLVSSLRAKYLMVSFNSEGYISKNEMINILEKVGTVTVLDISYNAFKGSRNLKNRDIYVSEYLFIVKKHKV
ncbi:MAG: DNA adenine methylase [Treponema sp.]|jgi:adenine-specific DNA-methyltransferase|nr:DNA adenine methylase [Treponema sp.]